MATKTQVVSASRAGVGSVVVTDSQSGNTQMVAQVGAESDPSAGGVTATPPIVVVMA